MKPRNKSVVLVLEDNANMRRGIATILEINHFTVYEVSNGVQGISLLDTIQPDLILTDINMPLMNGIAFSEIVRSDPKLRDIPIIFLTGNGAADNPQADTFLEIDEYLTKPINSKDLVRLIKTRLH